MTPGGSLTSGGGSSALPVAFAGTTAWISLPDGSMKIGFTMACWLPNCTVESLQKPAPVIVTVVPGRNACGVNRTLGLTWSMRPDSSCRVTRLWLLYFGNEATMSNVCVAVIVLPVVC